jgi:predicted AlkP superfamily phosphohydrolase/phosphomutase
MLVQGLPQLHTRAVNEHRYWNLDWSRTQVFASRHGGNLYVNLRGRQPQGIVPPHDYDPLLERVRGIVSDLTDPASGHRLVRGVYRREDLYKGPYLDQASDLVIEWDRERLRDELCYQADGAPLIVEAPHGSHSAGRWTGSHRHHGVFIARGPYIQPGGKVEDACLYDVAPTLLYLQGYPVPSDMDGRVLTEVLSDEHLRRNPVQWTESTDAAAHADAPDLDAHEARQVEDRLRGLGYIE